METVKNIVVKVEAEAGGKLLEHINALTECAHDHQLRLDVQLEAFKEAARDIQELKDRLQRLENWIAPEGVKRNKAVRFDLAELAIVNSLTKLENRVSALETANQTELDIEKANAVEAQRQENARLKAEAENEVSFPGPKKTRLDDFGRFRPGCVCKDCR